LHIQQQLKNVNNSSNFDSFNPYPDIIVNEKKPFVKGDKKLHQKVADLINKIPKVSKLLTYIEEGTFKEKCDEISSSLYTFLRWLMASNRSYIRLVPKKKQLSQFNTPFQFVLVNNSPEKETKFKQFRKKYKSIYAFHGSHLKNWHAIARNGLVNMTGTGAEKNGHAYGSGIYFAPNASVSFGYMNFTAGWKNSKMGSNIGCLSMSEICLHDDLKGQPNPYYVVSNDLLVSIRFLFIYQNNANVSVEGSQITHINLKKIFSVKEKEKKRRKR